MNAAVLEAVLIAAMRRVANGGDMSVGPLNEALQTLAEDPKLATWTTTRTDAEENVRSRLKAASDAFDV